MSLDRRNVVTPFALALLAIAPSSQTLVQDIDATAPTEPGGSDPEGFAFVGGLTFFSALGQGTGRELFVSDGTPAGSGLVADLLTGAESSDPREFTPYGGDMFFVANGNQSGVYKSDGTAQGTELFLQWADGLGVAGGNLYIRNVTSSSTTIYVSDGTTAGTSVLYTGTTNDGKLLGEMDGWFYFRGDGHRLYRTDGTVAGTELIKNAKLIVSQAFGDSILWYVDYKASTNEWELWKSDGTPGGTFRLKTFDFNPHYMTTNGDLCIFASGLHGAPNDVVDPWISDGTAAGTKQLISWGWPGSDPEFFVPWGDGFMFSVDGPDGYELFVTDGTTAGTEQVIDLNPGNYDSNPGELTVIGNEVYFRAGAAAQNYEIWKTDGTAEGTVGIGDLKAEGGSYPQHLATDGVTLWFSAEGDGLGREAFTTDGVTIDVAANLIPDPVSSSSTIEFVADLNGAAIFLADDGVHGEELWASRGTAGTTRMLADIRPGIQGITLHESVTFDDLLYFVASADSEFSLWATDGTPGGTFEVTPGMESSGVAVSNGKLYFTGDDPIAGLEPHVLSSKLGTPQVLADLGPGDSGGRLFHPVGDLTVFTASALDLGDELWVTDGTEAGTQLLADIYPGEDSSYPKNFTPMNGELFFTARTGSNYRIWSTDGTPGGTVLRVDPPVDLGSFGSPFGLTPTNDLLLFVSSSSAFAYDPVADTSFDLQVPTYVDGFDTFFPIGDRVLILDDDDETLYGVTSLEDVPDVLVTGTGFPLQIVVEPAGDVAFVQRDNDLLLTDGTPGGTTLVDELLPFSLSLYGWPDTQLHPTQVGSDTRVLVQGYDDLTGRELWVSDGTQAGTEFLVDIHAGPSDSNPSQFFRAGDQVFFTADDGIHGRELHVIPFGTTGGWVAESFGGVCPMTTGETPTMASTGAPVLGNAGFTVDYDGAPVGSAALLFYSPVQGVGTLGGGCALYFGTPWFLYPGSAVTDVSGHGSLAVPLPGDPALAGLALYFQYLVSDPGGVVFGAVTPTDGLEVLLGS